MTSAISQAQFNTSQQTIRETFIKVNLLDFNYATIDTLEGNIISGNVQINSDSDIRRTCDVSFVITDTTLDAIPNGRIWLDKLIQVYIGVKNSIDDEIVWTNLGIYLINQPTYQYEATTRTLSFQGLDLMSLLTGIRNGSLSGITYKIPAGNNIREVIIAILKENGFNKYVVSECYNEDNSIQDVPNDMEYEMGSTWYDILSDLRDILPNYQIYFDVDGVFHYEPIPYTDDEPIMIDDEIWDENVISETVNIDFESVKNSIEVYGKTHEIENYPTETTVNGTTINLTIATVKELVEYLMIGFKIEEDLFGSIKIKVNDLEPADLVDAYGNQIVELGKDEYWVARYTKNNKWEFLGHQQAYGSFKDQNTQSPFYVGNPAGEIKLVLYGGDYEYIYSDDLALQRAKFEIYQRCRLNDTVQITSVPVYWADVNWMVTYTPFNEKEPKKYIIKSISLDLTYSGTQTLELANYFPYYFENQYAKGADKIIRYSANPNVYILVEAKYADELLSYTPNSAAIPAKAAVFSTGIGPKAHANGYTKMIALTESIYHVIKTIESCRANSDISKHIIGTVFILDEIYSNCSAVGKADVKHNSKRLSMTQKAAYAKAIPINHTTDKIISDVSQSINRIAIPTSGRSSITSSATSKAKSSPSKPIICVQNVAVESVSAGVERITKPTSSNTKISIDVETVKALSTTVIIVDTKNYVLKYSAKPAINSNIELLAGDITLLSINKANPISTNNLVDVIANFTISLTNTATAEALDSWIYPEKDGNTLIIKQAFYIDNKNNIVILN